MDAEITFSINELASDFNVTTRTLRFYEAKALISPKKEGQRRIYSQSDRERLSFILRGKRLGFSLAEIAEMLDLYESDNKKKFQSKVIIDNIKEHIEILKYKRKDIDKTLQEMLSLVKEYE